MDNLNKLINEFPIKFYINRIVYSFHEKLLLICSIIIHIYFFIFIMTIHTTMQKVKSHAAEYIKGLILIILTTIFIIIVISKYIYVYNMLYC